MPEDQRRLQPLFATLSAQELRMHELLEKLDTATRLRLMEEVDEPRATPKTERQRS